MHSAIYEGTIRHRRFAVRGHVLRHSLAMAYLDLDELPDLLGGALVRARPGIVRFRRADYLGDPSTPLAGAVRSLVAQSTGEPAPTGPVRLLTQLRSFGHCFNPVSFYYCFAADGDRLAAIVAEVTSTPWGERHAYVLANDDGRRIVGGDLDKRLHVSPFMGMAQRYRWRATAPAETISVHISSSEGDSVVFDATLGLERRALTARTMADVTLRYPAATLRVLALIYAHAAALKLKGVPVQRHPGRAGARAVSPSGGGTPAR